MKSEYGYKIKNIQAGSLYDYNNGVRNNYDYKEAMFTNSLFLDFLLQNGLKISKNGKSTNDIICLNFDYGSRSYEEEVAHIDKLIKDTDIDSEKYQKLLNLKDNVEINKNKFNKKTSDEIRDMYYKNGVDITYNYYFNNGNLKRTETIHYKMLYRSTGKAKRGACMFINEKLYNKSHNFLYMDLKLPKNNSPIVEASAYIPLVSSTIIGKIKINPKNILIMKDIDSFFKTNIISIETDENKHCIAKDIDDYELKNTVFDGQALIDSSCFPSWANGYILLRHHFCKMATFSANIQDFFRDYYKDDYQNAKIIDMFGNEHYAKDIEVITTESAMKWLKFDVSYDYWCEKVYDNNCMFGIVKTAHQSKLGEVQRMSYQMVNSLSVEIMDGVVKSSVDYINKLKEDNNEEFLNYLSKSANFSNDYEVLVALCNQDSTFMYSDYFRDRKRKIIEAYVKRFKTGKIIQNADNLVLCGSPYAMLLQSVGEDIDNDDTLVKEDGTIQCYTERFNDNEYLAGFRSPHNSPNNILYLHNMLSPKIKKYFNFGEQIIAVNVNHTDIQDRGNGLDFDSDSIYTTNQTDIVNCAKECYKKFRTIVNNIPMEKNHYTNNLENYALIDNNLSKAQLSIGESSNLAQLCLSYSYNFDDRKFSDYVCILSVIAQVAIDSAKRRFDIDIAEEIKRIKKDINVKENGYPAFWSLIRPEFNKKNINESLKCPMNCLFYVKFNKNKSNIATIPINKFFKKFELEKDRRTCKKVEELIQKFSLDLYNWQIDTNVDKDMLILRSDFNDMINTIRQIYISNTYVGLMSWLIDRAFLISVNVNCQKKSITSTMKENRAILIKTLYDINPKCLLKCFSNNI